MEVTDELEIERLVQCELDAINLDDSIEDLVVGEDDDDNDDRKYSTEIEDEQEINETRRTLERDMQERLAAFENEVKANLDRYDIDYSEIDELLQKPTGTYENDIQTNVARECGIEREELDRILQNINTEEASLDSSIDSDSSEYKDSKIEIIKQNLTTIDTDKSVETTTREEEREQEDPNKKLYDERLAESHRRMLDELALLDQRRKEEEERYAIVLQDQQARLAEEYHRLQETLDESARQTRNEKLQFETLCREQDRLTNDRQIKMATLIQAWYRGKCIYRQYHGEILKRAAPTLRTIAKKRKKKEQELANAAKLAKIQEEKRIEKETEQKVETNSLILPIDNIISSPLPDTTNKKLNQLPRVPPSTETKEIIPPKENTIKKKNIQPKPQIVSKQTSSSILPTTQILQLENPIDFIPTIIPNQRTISSPRKIKIENNNNNTVHQIPSPPPPPIQTKEQRPKSSSKRQHSARHDQTQNDLPPTTGNSSITEKLSTTPVESSISSTSMIRSNTFEKKLESPRLPIETISTPPKPIYRSDTFHKDKDTLSSSPPPIIKSIDITSSISISRSNTFVDKFERSPSPPIEKITSIDIKHQSNGYSNHDEGVSSFNEQISIRNSIATVPIELPKTLKQSERISAKPDLPITPRISTPRKISKDEQHPTKKLNKFLNEAHCWAENTRDVTYSNLILSTEENLQQHPTRKTGANLRKLPDLDTQVLAKATKNQPSKQIHYLLIEQLLTPCSLSLIGTTYPSLTHLILRQCKLVQLVGLESCKLLTVLDVEGNWLEQIHIQLNHLEYLNMSRNRITSLLSMNTPNLKYLDVSKNRLTRLNGIETLKNLNILHATSNQLLTTIGLQGCTNLLHIDVSDNHLVEMEQIDQCPLLITIKASSNAVIQIPNLLNAILLNELDLSSNSLTSFDELSIGSWLPFLTHLRLSNNNLQELSSIKLPSLVELDLGFNQISDVTTLKRFVKDCPLLSRLNLEQNPVLYDITDSSSLIKEKSSCANPISILPQSLNEKSSQSIQLYLDFLANITSMFIRLRQTIEQHQIEPFTILKSIHTRCQQYYEQKIIEPMEIFEPVIPDNNLKILSVQEQSVIRLQAHWRRRLVERILFRKWRAAQKMQACWRGYALRQRMRNVRCLFSQQQQTFDEVDLSQFDFDEAAFDARFQRPRTPTTRVRQVWQSQPKVFPKTTMITELPHPNSSRSSSAASSRAKPIVEPLSIQARTNLITDEWGFSPSSSTAALMLKRAEKMKWNSERKHKREHMDAYQRLQIARQSELPPGSLRLARRQQALVHATKSIAHTKTLSPPATSQSRGNRVFEWVHTQVARFDDSSVASSNSPRNERKRLPSLDGSTDSMNRIRSSEALQQQQQQQRWSSSTVSIRQPPPLLPPINGHLPRA
ncbi:unnamed protein product [Rotaria magnacalcarata]|uniref:Leucine-rich repeat and IQ domain-containing protein 1 n=2 Tax=Rotaria magnacalcarata TaxID=392030 RepID=A0A819BHT2_9BILA|nr:unnamed protein product [Rotaria magnacalcarata]CAF3802352.1 unnamed protein product [Rotaria magnacalcarata]